MFTYKPVTVSRGAFRFCRYSVAIMMWIAVIWRIEELVIVCAAIMALSAILTVGRAPLITLYTLTMERIYPTAPEVLDENGMRFAHTVATIFMTLPLALVYSGQEALGWRLLAFVALFKTAGALGFCAVSRLYTCAVTGGTCCQFLKGRSRD